MVARIPGQSQKEEVKVGTHTFVLVKRIRSRRYKMGEILRLRDDRMVKQTLKGIFDNSQEGDIFRGIPAGVFRGELIIMTWNDPVQWRKSTDP